VCGAIGEVQFNDALLFRKDGHLQCTECGRINPSFDSSLYRFMKAYSKLVCMSEENLTVELIGYEIKSFPSLDNAKFRCLRCHKVFKLSIDRMLRFCKSPGSFHCPRCRICPPKLSDVKQYFIALRWVLRLQWGLIAHGICFDFFSPIGLVPEIALQLRERHIARQQSCSPCTPRPE